MRGSSQMLPPETRFHKGKCPNCGLVKDYWSNEGEGYTHEGETYCCKGCCEKTGCFCLRERPVVGQKGIWIDRNILPERRVEKRPWPPESERRSKSSQTRDNPESKN
jgi:hypothetical protein